MAVSVMMSCGMMRSAPMPYAAPMMMRCESKPKGGRSAALFFDKMEKLVRKSAPACEPQPQNACVSSDEYSLSMDAAFCDDLSGLEESCSPQQPPKDPLLQLVSLQKASGCWVLDPALAAALEKTSEDVEKHKPASANKEVWATILALVWLHGFKKDAQEEWELLAMKAVSWLRAQKVPSVTECVEAGNALLVCNVQKDTLGL